MQETLNMSFGFNLSNFKTEIENLCKFEDLNRTVYLLKMMTKITWYGRTEAGLALHCGKG